MSLAEFPLHHTNVALKALLRAPTEQIRGVFSPISALFVGLDKRLVYAYIVQDVQYDEPRKGAGVTGEDVIERVAVPKPAIKIFDGSKDPAVRCRGCGNTYPGDSKEWWSDVFCIHCHDVDLHSLTGIRHRAA